MDSSKESAFYKLCEWFDSEMESGVYTVSQLHEPMKTLAGDDLPVYHERYLKQASRSTMVIVYSLLIKNIGRTLSASGTA